MDQVERQSQTVSARDGFDLMYDVRIPRENGGCVLTVVTAVIYLRSAAVREMKCAAGEVGRKNNYDRGKHSILLLGAEKLSEYWLVYICGN